MTYVCGTCQQGRTAVPMRRREVSAQATAAARAAWWCALLLCLHARHLGRRHGCGLVSLEGRRHSLCLGGSGHTFHNEEVGRLGRRRLELLIEDAAAQVASQVHRCAHCGRALARLSQGVDCQLAEQRRELLPLAVRDALRESDADWSRRRQEEEAEAGIENGRE